MSVYLRENRYWYRFKWTWTENGEHRTTEIRNSGRGANKRETKSLEEAHREDLRRGEVHPLAEWPKVEPLKPKAPTFSEYAALVWQNIGPHLKPRTLSFYQECSERMARFEPFASLPLSEIGKATVDSYVAWRLRQRKGNSPHGINAELRTLRRVLRYAVETGLIDRCPAIHCLPAEGRNRVISPEEEARYLAVAQGDLRDAFLILIDSGLRPDSELFPLKWEDVLERGIRVRRGKTESACRLVLLTQRARGVLEMRRAVSNGSPYVFPGPGATGHLATLKKPHYRACRESGVECFPLYSLRHTFGTRCAVAGVDRYALAYLMGHSSPAITARYYVHVGDKHIAASFEIFKASQQAALPPAPVSVSVN